ncbi:MAG: PilN domain-containing protein [Candidatus Omnitrophica bacterium]|nr:PilN domain-containing protein [Candidatus Omnitrophota bacterium]
MAKPIDTVIEITDTHIKFLQAKRENKKSIITAFDTRSIQDLTDDNIEQALLAALRSRQIVAEKCVMVLPRRLVSVKRLRLPTTQDKEIQKMLPLQIANLIPHSIDDVTYGYEVIQRESTGYSQLIVYIVHKDVNEKYLHIFSKAKIAPSQFVLSSSGIVSWFNFQKQKDNVTDPGPVLLLNLDLNHSEICFIQNQRLLFSRSVNYGLKDLRADNFVGFFDQIDLSVKSYRKEHLGDDVESIFVVSSLPEMTTLNHTLAEKFQLPVVFYSPVENVYSAGAPIVNQIKECPGLSLTVCLGLLFSDRKNLVNLVAQDMRVLSTAKTQRQRRSHFLFFFFLSIALGFSIWGIDMFYRMIQLQRVKALAMQALPAASQAQKNNALTEFFDRYFANRIVFSDLIAVLNSLTPAAVSFTSLNTDHSGNVTIGGYAQLGSDVNRFQTSLVKSPRFSDAQLLSAKKRKYYNQEVTEFKIQFKIRPRK